MRLIVGLGNPGARYRGTRHNVGADIVRTLGARHQARWQAVRRQGAVVARYAEWSAGRRRIRACVPETFMNVSGEALQAMRAWPVEPADLLLVLDDVNLPLGVLRMKPKGSAGGHHGLASCLAALQTEQVARLRVGIGVEPLPRDLTDFVLSPFRADERARLAQITAQAAEACERWATEGIDVAMTRVNRGHRLA